MADVKTIEFLDFTEGIDRRRGVISRDGKRLYDAENTIYTSGHTIRRRPPAERLAGDLDNTLSQNLLYLNGQYITIAKAGTTPAHTIVGIPVVTKYFDNPEYATDWELLWLGTQNEVVIAVIRHSIPGIPTRIMWHYWDDVRPTWCEDPAAPTNWSKSFPLHAFGVGTMGEWKDYRPSIDVSADKLMSTLPDGNVGASATNRPRVWNDRTAQDILDNGRWWYWISPSVVGALQFTIPIHYYELLQDLRWGAYVLERCMPDGTWIQFTEVGTPLAPGEYGISPTANRFDPTKPEETLITIAPGVAVGRIIRFRAIAKPPVQVQLGCYLTPSGDVVGGIVNHQGASHDIQTDSIVPLTGSTAYYAAVIVPGAPIPLSTAILGASGTMPLNGQQRYWTRLLANATTDVAGTAFEFAYTGTVDITADSALIKGTATAFLSEARIGEAIEVNGERRIIKTIAADDRIETTEPFTETDTGLTALRDVRYKYAYEIGDAGNDWYAARETEAAVTLSGNADTAILNTSLYDNSGGIPVALAGAQNRLIVLYAQSIQLWKTDQDPNLMAHLSTDGIGAGPHTAPQGAQVYGYTMLPTNDGPTLFSPSGLNKDYIKFDPVGEKLYGIALPDLRNAVWWPRLQAYVTAGIDDGRLFVFNNHPDERVAGWSIWNVRELTRVDSLFVVGQFLVVRSGSKVWRFDATSTVYRDSTDTDAPFLDRSRWLYNDFGQPSKTKKLVRMDINQDGRGALRVYPSPFNRPEYTEGPSINGMTQGRQRIAISAHAAAVSVELSSRDETGHEIYSFGFDYQLLKR